MFTESNAEACLECDITISSPDQTSISNAPDMAFKFQELIRKCNTERWPPQLTVKFIPQNMVQKLKGLFMKMC